MMGILAQAPYRDRFPVAEAELAEFCRRWKIAELSLFGSALREDFRPDSDIDLLVTFAPEADWSLLEFAHIQNELSDLLGRPVDLVGREEVESSRNRFRRGEILATARPIYAAA